MHGKAGLYGANALRVATEQWLLRAVCKTNVTPREVRIVCSPNTRYMDFILWYSPAFAGMRLTVYAENALPPPPPPPPPGC